MQNEQSGFSLIETVVAMGILATGLLGLAGVFTLGMAHMATSSANLIAREKAREAVESVHTARDTRVITWAQINNQTNGGVFKDAPSQAALRSRCTRPASTASSAPTTTPPPGSRRSR